MDSAEQGGRRAVTDRELVVAAAGILGWEVITARQYHKMRGIPHADTVVEQDGILYRRDSRDYFVLPFNPLELWSDAGLILTTMRDREETHPEEWDRFMELLDWGRILPLEPERAPRLITEAAVTAVRGEV